MFTSRVGAIQGLKWEGGGGLLKRHHEPCTVSHYEALSFICVANMSWLKGLGCKYQSLSEDLTPFLLHIIIIQKRE